MLTILLKKLNDKILWKFDKKARCNIFVSNWRRRSRTAAGAAGLYTHFRENHGF